MTTAEGLAVGADSPTLTTVSVVVAAFASERWPQTVRAIESVRTQSYTPIEIVLVIDHNPALFASARTHFSDMVVIENAYIRGASGARNTGIEASRGELVAFLDDDAVADREWLAASVPHFKSKSVVGVGGRITPLWESPRPRWFPEEILWAVGATYRGMPSVTSKVRNVWAGNMLVRRTVCEAVGGFRLDFGKRGDREDFQAEDTEFCLRTASSAVDSEAGWLFEPRAVAAHHVPARRSTWPFLVARCFHEGRNKVIMSNLLGSDITGRERTYVLRTLPSGMLRGLVDLTKGDAAGLTRSATIGACTVAGVLGALVGEVGHRLPRGKGPARGASEPLPPVLSIANAEGLASNDEPVLVRDLDLSEPFDDLLWEDVRGTPTGGVQVLVRFASEPLGILELVSLPDKPTLAAALWDASGSSVSSRLTAAGLRVPSALSNEGVQLTHEERLRLPWVRGRRDALEAAPRISVVICTRDPDEGLELTLAAASELDYPTYEIVLVDNASTSDAVERLIASRKWAAPIRLTAEPRPGLSRARTAGLRLASGDLVAFLDDDEIPDAHWLSEYARAFHEVPEAVAASGLILARALDTPAQRYFEGLGGHSKGRGFERQVFDVRSHSDQHPLYPMPPFGAGGNMCFRRQVLLSLGGFDEALGAGTPTRGGEDTAAFADVMLAGFTTVWQPSAFVRHSHYDTFDGAGTQLRGYGIGLSAFFTRMVVTDPRRMATLLRLASRAVADVRRPGATLIGQQSLAAPRNMKRAQWLGLASGPLLYGWSRIRHMHRRGDRP
jgi:glycosyltransferase involved in cell wall biosynthesis